MDVVERPANPRMAELVLPGLRSMDAHDRRRALRAAAGAPLDVDELAGLASGLVLAAWLAPAIVQALGAAERWQVPLTASLVALVIAFAALVHVRRGLRARLGGAGEAKRDDR
jgi:hypothetical protein